MNAFRLVGDLLHLLALIILVVKIWRTRSCAGISGKTQILYALVYLTRYLDLFTNFISVYNSTMKVVFIGCSCLTLCLVYFKFRDTYDHKNDTFRIEILVLPVVGLSILINHQFEQMEVLWTFSIYLEAVAILPQLYLVSKTGKVETIISHYLLAMCLYRIFYIFNWIYRYYMDPERFYDIIVIISGIVQTGLYFDYYCNFWCSTSLSSASLVSFQYFMKENRSTEDKHYFDANIKETYVAGQEESLTKTALDVKALDTTLPEQNKIASEVPITKTLEPDVLPFQVDSGASVLLIPAVHGSHSHVGPLPNTRSITVNTHKYSWAGPGVYDAV